MHDREGGQAFGLYRGGEAAPGVTGTEIAVLPLGARRELGRFVDEATSAVDAAGLGAAGDVLRATARFVAARKK